MQYSKISVPVQNITHETLQLRLCSMETSQQLNLTIRIKIVKVKYKVKFNTKCTNFYSKWLEGSPRKCSVMDVHTGRRSQTNGWHSEGKEQGPSSWPLNSYVISSNFN